MNVSDQKCKSLLILIFSAFVNPKVRIAAVDWSDLSLQERIYHWYEYYV